MVSVKTRTSLMILHETTGSQVSGVSSCRSTQTQYLGLNLVRIAVGALMQWNTHVGEELGGGF